MLSLTGSSPSAYELYAGLKDVAPNEQTPSLPNSPISLAAHASDVESKTEGPVEGPTLPKVASVYNVQADHTMIIARQTPPPAAIRTPSDSTQPKAPERVFKEAFCREVNVHFVGAW